MAITSQKQINLRFEILPRATKKALDFLSQQKWISQNGWYLAGGTALTLHVAHRKSVDLDFFTPERDFDNNEFLTHFHDSKDWKTVINKKNTVYGTLYNAKISFIAYPFFIPALDYTPYGWVRILQPRDIAVMKIVAISQRGRKRDFYDLYWCANNFEPLEQIIGRLPAQYPTVAHDYHHILKSLVYFADAEKDPMPEITFRTRWSEVKTFFQKEVPRITRTVMAL
ncbi:MAG: nucleotidyl transferase AbiEii/AbiGii toxin family protein [bacterium]|nr:nucleotidyl transferase AbiEii/AbiGii toxin family protein [bacterium]